MCMVSIWHHSCAKLTFVFNCFFLALGAIYLKNCMGKYWRDREPGDDNELPCPIPEQSKTLIRDNIIASIIQSPPLIW